MTAAVDPPLYAGLYMFSRDLVAYFGVLHDADALLRTPLRASYVAKAYDAARVSFLFGRDGAVDRVAELFASAAREISVVVKDRELRVIAAGATPDEARVDRLVEAAAALTRRLGERALEMPQRPEEIAAKDRWQALAVSLGLAFDHRRWHLFGRIDDVDVSVVLEGSPPAVSTTFRARFRRSLACGLHLRRGYQAKAVFTTWRDGHAPGFPELDGVVVLDAQDLDRARSLLANGALRILIAEEATTSNVVITDHEIVLGRGGFALPREITRRLEAVRSMVDHLTPRAVGHGPFR